MTRALGTCEPVPASRADAAHACTRKRRFTQQDEAQREAERLHALDGEMMDVYECPHCGGWHVGRVPEWLRRDREMGVYAGETRWTGGEHRLTDHD